MKRIVFIIGVTLVVGLVMGVAGFVCATAQQPPTVLNRTEADLPYRLEVYRLGSELLVRAQHYGWRSDDFQIERSQHAWDLELYKGTADYTSEIVHIYLPDADQVPAPTLHLVFLSNEGTELSSGFWSARVREESKIMALNGRAVKRITLGGTKEPTVSMSQPIATNWVDTMSDYRGVPMIAVRLPVDSKKEYEISADLTDAMTGDAFTVTHLDQFGHHESHRYSHYAPWELVVLNSDGQVIGHRSVPPRQQ